MICDFTSVIGDVDFVDVDTCLGVDLSIFIILPPIDLYDHDKYMLPPATDSARG